MEPRKAADSTIIFGIPKLPPRAIGIVMPLILSALMSGVVSAVNTFRYLGLSPEFPGTWLANWGASWLVAFPVVLLVLPLVRRLTSLLVRSA